MLTSSIKAHLTNPLDVLDSMSLSSINFHSVFPVVVLTMVENIIFIFKRWRLGNCITWGNFIEVLVVEVYGVILAVLSDIAIEFVSFISI